MTNATQTASAAALATANWWADHVFGGTIGDHGGDGMTVALSVITGVQGTPAPADKRSQFVERLAARIDGNLNRDGGERFGMSLRVDYGPKPPLSDIARDLEIRGAFPWKTSTYTYPTHVVASLGYAAPSRLVWQAEDWERPACHAGKWGDGPDATREPWKCSAPQYHDGDHVFDVPEPLCGAEVDAWGNGKPEPCLRPEGHEWHRDDGYGGRRHEFVTAAH